MTSLVLDGHGGHRNAWYITRQSHLHLIAKLRGDAALYFPDVGPSAGRGPHRQDGHKVAYDHIPGPYLQATRGEGHLQTRWDQAPRLHKECAPPVNVVILANIPRHTQARAHVLLFSSALELGYAPLVDSYRLRFHIEVHFREAKQSWGLEDFMNVPPTGVTKAANRALFMVHVAYQLRTDVWQRAPDSSILDLKADCRGYKSVEETIKRLPEQPAPVLLTKRLNRVTGVGRIHASQASFTVSSLAQVLLRYTRENT